MNKRVRESWNESSIHYFKKENFDNESLRSFMAKIYLEDVDSDEKINFIQKAFDSIQESKLPTFELNSAHQSINSCILTLY